MIDHRPARLRIVAAALVLADRAESRPRRSEPLAFEVTYDAGVRPGPISARVYVMLGPAQGGRGEPRKGPDWFRPQPFFAVDAEDWKPGEPLRVGAGCGRLPRPARRARRRATTRPRPSSGSTPTPTSSATARGTPTGRSSSRSSTPRPAGRSR